MNDINTLSDNQWIINGNVYDLTKFLTVHPGGPTILNMNRRRDCTELFETYHLLSSRKSYINSMMKSYFIRTATNQEIGTLYDWNDIKYKEMKLNLRKRIHRYFIHNKSLSLSAYKAHNIYKSFYLIQFLLLMINTYFYLNGYWISIIFVPIFGWNFSGDIIHSGLHYAIFSNYFLNELVSYLFGFYHCNFCVWFFQHTISHHSYTNIDEYDADLCWHEELWFDQEDDDEINIIKYKHSTKSGFICKMALISPLTSLMPILSIIDVFQWSLSKWIYLKWRFMKLPMMISYIQTFIVVLFIPYFLIKHCKMGFIIGFLFFLIPRFIHGVIYHIFSQINHINRFSFQNNELQQTKNFIIHQIMSTCDYGVDSTFIGVISCGLNNQVLHHLFPNVHHCHYPKLSKILKEFCKEYGIKQSIHNNLTEAIYCYMDYLLSINVKH